MNNKMRYIIMAGGVYPKWETPRQLTVINNESLVQRTIRLLRENGIEDIAITAQDERFEQFGVPVLHHENSFVWGKDAIEDHSYWVDAFYPSEEPTCYLFGDVFFSPFAIASIVNYTGEDIMFFASAICNGKGYIKPWAEPFAFKVWNQKRFRDCINQTKILQDQGAFRRKPVSWELWQVIKGTQLNVIVINYHNIEDYTCDVDSPEDAKRIEQLGVI